jgi:hypothetical protein
MEVSDQFHALADFYLRNRFWYLLDKRSSLFTHTRKRTLVIRPVYCLSYYGWSNGRDLKLEILRR